MAAFEEIFAEGDACRDRQDWAQARDLYRQALDLDEACGPLWVQYGHALKESGDPAAAETAYRRALRLGEDPADTLLQLGHALKIQGRHVEAARAYAQIRLHAVSELAFAELTALGWGMHEIDALRSYERQAPDRPAAATILDVTDLVAFARRNLRPSGIQRVQSEIVRVAIKAGMAVDFVHLAERREHWMRITPAILLGVIDSLLAGRIEGERAVDLEAAIRQLDVDSLVAEPLVPTTGARMISLGGCWAIPDHARHVAEWAAQGMRYEPFVYDLVPLMRPQFCTLDTVLAFERWIGEIAPHVSRWLTCSDHTARDLERTLGASPDIRVVPLDGRFGAETAFEPAPVLERLGLTDRPFVLFVSTLEPRKNHVVLFHAFRRLAARFGARTPRLVLVGKIGWLAEETLDLLDAMGENVVHLASVGDDDLAALYEGAMCTVYPGLYEGWGLPVTESLCFGRVPLVADMASLPQAAAGFGVTFDPHGPEELVAALACLIEQPERLAELERRIALEFRPRPWRQIAEDIIG